MCCEKPTPGQRKLIEKQTKVLTRAEESILAIESLIALGTVSALVRADWCKDMTIHSLLVLFLALFVLVFFVSLLFLHKGNQKG